MDRTSDDAGRTFPAIRRLGLAAVAVALAFATGCDEGLTTPEAPEAEALGKAVPQTNVVEVTALHQGGQHLFDLSTDEVPSGWTTFRFDNEAHVHHFAFLSKVPDDITLEQYYDEVTLVFQNFMDFFMGNPPSFPDAGFDLPAWFGSVQPIGGPGLTAARKTSYTTLELEPGNYIVECYVKTPGGTFHAVDRMLAQLTVTANPSGASEPRATLDMTIRNPENGGIQAPESVRPGKHTVAVHFAEQMVHGNLVGSDVHLVRLDDATDLDELADWMNWVLPDGLATPAPASFVGGAHERPAGETAYLTVLLEPGTYAWIAEVDDPDGKSMLRSFNVPFGRTTGR